MTKKAIIHQSEFDFISKAIVESPNIATGGDLFGFWNDSGLPVIKYAIGAGRDSIHMDIFFQQDEKYLAAIKKTLENKDSNLQHIGQWYSHHSRRSEEELSGYETSKVRQTIEDCGLSKFFVVIARIVEDTLSLNGFIFSNEGQEYFPVVDWEVVAAESPIRIYMDRVYKPPTKISPTERTPTATLASSPESEKAPQNNKLLLQVDKKVTHIETSIERLVNAQKDKRDNSQNLFDKVYEERTKYRDSFFTNKFEKPLIKDLILLYDNIKSRIDDADSERSQRELQFVLDDLVSILERMDVITYKNYFGPEDYPKKRNLKFHKVLGFVDTKNRALNNTVASILKDGFLWNDKVTRPENVKLYKTKI